MRAAPEGWAVEGTEDLDRGCKDGSEAFLENCVDESARRVAHVTRYLGTVWKYLFTFVHRNNRINIFQSLV